MGGRRTGAGFAPPHLHDDDGLGESHIAGHIEKRARIRKPLDVHGDHLGGRVVAEVAHHLEHGDVRLIADVRPLGEPHGSGKIGREHERRGAESPALGDEAHPPGHLPDTIGESRVEMVVGVHDAHAVGPHHPYARPPGDGQDALLQLHAFGHLGFAEPGSDDHSRLDPSLALRLLEDLGHGERRNGDHDQLDLVGDGVKRRIALETKEFVQLRVDEVDSPLEAEVEQVPRYLIARFALVPGDPYDRYARGIVVVVELLPHP